MAGQNADRERRQPPSIAGRLPPHNLDAEAAVLSAILLSREALDRVLDVLRPEHFYADANGRIFEAVKALAIAGAAIDVLTVVSWLRDRELIALVGGPSYVALIADASPAVLHVEHHAAIVREKWRMRLLIATCQTIAAEGYGDVGEPQGFIDAAAQKLGEIALGEERCTSVSMRDALDAGAVELEPKKQSITGLPFGLVNLDAALAGMHARDVIIVGGPTGRGKTSFAGSVVLHVAHVRRVGALWIGLDNMPEGELANRFASMHGKVDLMRLKGGRAQPRDWERLNAAREEIHELPILFECHARLTAMQVRAKIRAARDRLARAGTPLGLVVLDYFQKLRGEERPARGREETRESELRRASDVLQETAQMFELPIMLLAQEHEDRVKDCAAAGENAQVRLSIAWKEAAKRAAPPGMTPPLGHPATITVKKARGGRLGPAETYFYPQFTLFSDEAP